MPTSSRRRACSARAPARIFWHVLVPLLAPGILAASLLVLVRTIAMFELTFLTAGSDSQTLVVALYYAVFAAGVRAPQSVDAMAMIYMARHARVAADRAALRQPDAARLARQGASASRSSDARRRIGRSGQGSQAGSGSFMRRTLPPA